MLEIYVGSYKGYNEGVLDGAWHSLPNDDIWGNIRDSCVEGAEEFGIFDSDGTFDINEHEDIDMLNELAGRMERMSWQETDAVAALMEEGYDIEEAFDSYRDCIYYPLRSMEEVAKYYHTELACDVDDATPLAEYIDWKEVGGDMYVERNFVETPDGYFLEVIR